MAIASIGRRDFLTALAATGLSAGLLTDQPRAEDAPAAAGKIKLGLETSPFAG